MVQILLCCTALLDFSLVMTRAGAADEVKKMSRK
jgi:hypothetical protein